MSRTTVSRIALTLSLATVLALALGAGIQLARASDTTIHIRADGRIEPLTAPVSTFDNVTYTFTGNINNSIVVEKSNLIVDGAGYLLQGLGAGIGIDASGGNNVTIENANIMKFYYGICLNESSNSSVKGNNITSNIFGVWNDHSSGNNISGNNITNNVSGIMFLNSSNNNVSSNLFLNDGLVVWDSSDNVVENNSVNGKALVYLESVSGRTVSDAGQVILVNCNHIRVENLNLSRSTIGAQLWKTTYTTLVGNIMKDNSYVGVKLDDSLINTVIGNNITGNGSGVWFGNSSNNSISGNNITENSIGVWFNCSSNNSISGNNITENSIGVWFGNSSNNSISGNNVASNGSGVWFSYSSSNSIHHNDFVNNLFQAYSTQSMNVWDDGYPSGGNYWSDYTGRDLCNGVYQNETGSDWIGDSSYTINQSNIDRYPLMHSARAQVQEYEVAYRDLLTRYDEICSEFVALNLTCRTQQESLQRQIDLLNSTCVNLDQSLADLQRQVNGLNLTTQAFISELQEKNNMLSDQVNILLNLAYVIVGLLVVVIIVAIYFGTRRLKTVVQTEMETSKAHRN